VDVREIPDDVHDGLVPRSPPASREEVGDDEERAAECEGETSDSPDDDEGATPPGCVLRRRKLDAMVLTARFVRDLLCGPRWMRRCANTYGHSVLLTATNCLYDCKHLVGKCERATYDDLEMRNGGIVWKPRTLHRNSTTARV
jgi:hypothetical protein